MQPSRRSAALLLFAICAAAVRPEKKDKRNKQKRFSRGDPDVYSAQLLTCNKIRTETKTWCKADSVLNLNKKIRATVTEHFEKLDPTCDKHSCHRGDLAGCIVRFVGHDLMDYHIDDEGNPAGGADACIDFEDPDNAGLKGCLLESVQDEDESHLSLEMLWQGFCHKVSAADFFVIVAEVLMVRTMPEQYRETWGRRFEDSFRFGRRTQQTCKPPHLPNPAESCDATKKNFVDQLGLDWTAATALMGVHTLGRAAPENSGFNGFWVSGRHGMTFSNEYYKTIVATGWRSKSLPSGKTQWVRADDGPTGEMMLNTDMCLAFQGGDTAPFTRSEDESLKGCCMWFEKIEGIESQCIVDGAVQPTSLGNCCGDSPSCPHGRPADFEQARTESQGETLPAVLRFARSMDDWLEEFIDAWHQVTEQGHDLCHGSSARAGATLGVALMVGLLGFM